MIRIYSFNSWFVIERMGKTICTSRPKLPFSLRKKGMILLVCGIFLNLVFQGYKAKAQTTVDYDWKNAPIGGGGFVTASATNMGAAGRVAVSADGGTILHCPWGSTTTYYTTNNGGSWSSCSGVSVGDAVPVA